MSFTDDGVDVFHRAEATIHSLIADALTAKAYDELTVLEQMASAFAAARRALPRPGTSTPAAGPTLVPSPLPQAVPLAPPAPPVPPPVEIQHPHDTAPAPSWMRPPAEDRQGQQRFLSRSAPGATADRESHPDQDAVASHDLKLGHRSAAEPTFGDSPVRMSTFGAQPPATRSKWPLIAVLVALVIAGGAYAIYVNDPFSWWQASSAVVPSTTAAPEQPAAPQVEAPEANPAQTTSPEPTAPLQLEIHPTAAVTVHVSADGKEVVAGVVGPGEQRVVSASEEIALQIEDASGFAYTINGIPGRPLGAAGTVINTRITPSNFTDFQVR